MRRLALVLAVTALCAGGSAAADGGPSPGIDFGAHGVVGPDGQLRYVSVPALKGSIVEAIRVHNGRVQRWWNLAGTYGVPYVANDRQTGGLSRDGKTLVLASYAS